MRSKQGDILLGVLGDKESDKTLVLPLEGNTRGLCIRAAGGRVHAKICYSMCNGWASKMWESNDFVEGHKTHYCK